MENKKIPNFKDVCKVLILEKPVEKINEMWFYNVAKKIGFDLDCPTYATFTMGGTIIGYIYHMKETPLYIKEYYGTYDLYIEFSKDFPPKTKELEGCRYLPNYDNGTPIFRLYESTDSSNDNYSGVSNVINDDLFIKLVNELLDYVGYDNLPDDIDLLFDIVNGKEL
jgi:hypothetical protein